MYRKYKFGPIRIFYLASILVLSLFIGCAATKPNLSIIDKNYAPTTKIEKDKNFLIATSLLNELSLRNHLLAQELGKLPEIQDGISNSEESALEHIVDIYNEIPKEFNDAFDKIYRVGMPEVRKYCSPLQALFWLSCENQIQDIKKILHDYSLVQLLYSAWKFEKEHTVTKKQLSSIIDGTKNQRLKEEYTDYLDSLELSKLERAIFFDYQSNPKYFKWQARKIIKEEEKLRIDPRWVNFDEVTDRLNAPELVDHYEKRRISYQYWWDIPGYSSDPTPYYVF